MKTLLVPGLAALILTAATITPAAIHLSEWHAAGAAFEAAVAHSAEVAEEGAAAQASDEEARDAATVALADGSGVASAGAGYLAAGPLSDLTTANGALTDALAVNPEEGSTMPGTARPDTIAGLRDSAASLLEWADDEAQRAEALDASSDGLTGLVDAVNQAAIAAAQSVTTESAAALAVSPVASADSKAAFEAARDALAGAAGKGVLAEHVKAYATTVEAMFTSQRAEAEAAAARAAAEAEADDFEWESPLDWNWVIPQFEPLTPEQLCAGGAYYYCAPWLYSEEYLHGGVY